MWTNSQVLVVIGLVFEYLSVLSVAYKAFYPWDKEKRKMKHLDETGMTNTQKLEKNKRMAILIVLLLSIGMLLQAIGLFV